MLVQLFDVQDKKVVPSQSTYFIPELKAIIDNYPDNYLKVLRYIFHMTCPDGTNCFVNLEENMKEEVILRDLYPFDVNLDDILITRAMEKCRELYETPSLRIWKGAKTMLGEMSNKLQNESLTFGKNGNATDMRGIMKEIRGYTEDFIKLESMLKEEQSKVRGDIKRRYDQKGDYKDRKDDTKERTGK